MKIEDKYDIGKTLLLVAAFVIIAWTAAGCAGMPVEEREYETRDRANQCFDLARQYPRYTITDSGYTTFKHGLAKRCPELLDRRKRRQAGLS